MSEDNNIQQLFERGYKHLAENQYFKAKECFEKVQVLDPDYTDAINNLAKPFYKRIN